MRSSRSRWSCAKCRCRRLGKGEALLAVGAVSVCGSDVHQAHNTHSWGVNVPVVLGHEFGGTIARLGRGPSPFREGDRVVSETAAEICGACVLCRTGRYNLCPARKGFGYGVDGAMAKYVRVPARCLHNIPDSLPFDLACLSEPHSVAYQAMCINSTIRPGDSVVVLGPGPIGLLCTRMAALSGAHPLIVAGLAGDRTARDGAHARRDAHGERRRRRSSTRSCDRCRRSAPIWCATRLARAARSRPP